MRYPTILGSTGLLLLSAGTDAVAFGQSAPYVGIYAIAPYGNDGHNLGSNDKTILASAFASPFVRGVMVLTQWNQVEPLRPGVGFTAANMPVTLTLAGSSVTWSCKHPGAPLVDPNYCYDTIDEQLNEITAAGRNVAQTWTTNPGTVIVPVLAIGLGIQAGYHSLARRAPAPTPVTSQYFADANRPLSGAIEGVKENHHA